MRDILIVEDGLHERKRLNRLFTGADFSVNCAENVQEAEGQLDADPYRLVILDIGLEDKSGSHLFRRIMSASETPFVIILTGNPSTHLKQRFLDEGAAAYIVKASAAATNDSLLSTVQSLLGSAAVKEEGAGAQSTIPLREFLGKYVARSSQGLFFDVDDEFPPCKRCKGQSYVVTFDHKAQLPPSVEGKVVCVNCGSAMDPELG